MTASKTMPKENSGELTPSLSALASGNDAPYQSQPAMIDATQLETTAAVQIGPMPQRTEIVFIESNVTDYQTLIDGVNPGAEVHVLDAGQDGLAQMAQILSGRSGIDAIHIVSHGSEASVQLGALDLSSQNLQAHAADLAAIGGALKQDGDILLYGCDVAKGSDGAAFVQALAQDTHAVVGASTNLTGAAGKGGNWTLEYATGALHVATLHDYSYQNVLATTATYGFDTGLPISSGTTTVTSAPTSGTAAAGETIKLVSDGGGLWSMQTMYTASIAGADSISTDNTTAVTTITVSLSSGNTFDLTSFKEQEETATAGTLTLASNKGGTNLTYPIGTGGIINTHSVSAANFTGITSFTMTYSATWTMGFDDFVFANITAPVPTTTVSTAALSADTGSSGTDFITKTAAQTISGTLSAVTVTGETVEVSLDNGTSWATATNTIGQSTWSLAGQNLSGSDTLQARVTNANGSSTAYTHSYVYDATNPTAAISSTITTNTGATGTISSGGVTKDNTLALTGTYSDTNGVSSVQIYDGATLLGSAALAAGNWSYTTGALADAAHSFTAVATDTAGNTTTTLAVTATVDTVAPALTGTVGIVSNNSTNTLAKTGDTVTVSFTTDGTQSGSPTATIDGHAATITNTSGNNYTATYTMAGADTTGAVTFAINASDAAGNAMTAVTAVTDGSSVTYDKTAPTAAISSTITTSTGATGTISSGGVTKDNTLALTGTYSDTNGVSSVQIYDGATLLGSATLSGGNWSYTTGALADGAHSFTAVATDTPGNTTTTSAVTATVDTTNPAIASAVAGQAVNDNATKSPFSTMTFTDASNVTVQITLDTAAKGSFTTLSGFTNAGGGVYTYTNTAANATTAIQGLVFTPTANRVAVGSTETTTFSVQATDAASNAVTDATTTVVSTSINDAPVLAATGPAMSGLGINPAAPSNGSTTGSTLVSALVGGITDADTGAVKGIAVTAIDTTNGTLYYSTDAGANWTAAGAVANNNALLLASDANTRLYYQSNTGISGNIASALTFRAWDQTGGGTAASKVDTTTNGGATAFSTATDTASIAIYPPPTIGSFTASQAVNDNATISPFSASTIANTGTGNNVTVTVTLDTQAKGSFTTLSGFTDNGNGSYTLSNVAAATAQTDLRGLVFTPTANRVNPTLTETTTFTVNVADATTTVAASNSTTTVVSTSINDAPVVGGATAVTNINDNATATPFSSFTISDADTAQSQTLTVTLDTAAKGALSTLSGGSYNATTGVYSFTGTAAAAQAAIRALVFTPTANRVAVGSTETTTFTVSVNDSIAAAATNSATTVVSTSINNAPTGVANLTLASINQGTTNPPGAAISALTGYNFQDVDVGATNPGILVVGNTADAVTQGAWQYTSDGTNWKAIGTVADDATALALALATQLRFVPVASFSGAPTALSVRALDNTSGIGAFSTTTGGTETRITADSSANGAATAISGTLNTIATSVTVPSSGGGAPAPTPTGTTTKVDDVDVSSTTTTTKTTVKDPVTGQEKTVTSEVTVTTVPIVTDKRQDVEGTPSSQADIPLVRDNDGGTVLQASLPVGVGLSSEAVTGSSTLTLRELLISATQPREDQAAFATTLTHGIDSYVPSVRDEKQVTVRTITFQAAPDQKTAIAQPIVITGGSGTGEHDANHPDRQEALVIDVSKLPSGTVLQLDNVEFAIIIGASRVTGGSAQNFAIGDDAVQYMVLGEDDDILRGGGGDDTVGSKGGNDKLYGDDGNDLVVGGVGDDLLEGGNGDDVLQGGLSDAGVWSFRLGQDGALKSTFTATDSNLAGGSSSDLSGQWFVPGTADTKITTDARMAFTTQSEAKLETIALLSNALYGSLPDVYTMSYWAGQNLSREQYDQLAYQAYLAAHPQQNQTTQEKVAALINTVWGNNAATPELIAFGTQYIDNGGSWATALDALSRHDNAKAKLLDSRGEMALTKPYQSAELGWSADTGNDQLYGGSGNDTLVGGRGHNLLNGGAGTDSAVVVENSNDYQFRVDGNGQLLLKHLRRDDVDTLVEVENLVFADKTLDVSATNLDAVTLKAVIGLFRLMADTAPSLTELNREYSQGLTIAALANQLTHDAGYQKHWAGLTNDQFVTQLSTEIAGTPLTGAAHSYWVEQLANGMSREHVMIESVGVASYQATVFGGAGVLITV